MEYHFFGSFSIIDFPWFFNADWAGRDEKTFARKFLFFNDSSWHWHDVGPVQFRFRNFMVFDQYTICETEYMGWLFCLFYHINRCGWFDNWHPDRKI